MLVTKKAPDFKAKAFHNGKITEVSLENFRGKWDPGDFTFV